MGGGGEVVFISDRVDVKTFPWLIQIASMFSALLGASMTSMAMYSFYARLTSPNAVRSRQVDPIFIDSMARSLRRQGRLSISTTTNGVSEHKTSQGTGRTRSPSGTVHSESSTSTNISNALSVSSLNATKPENSSPTGCNHTQNTSQTHARILLNATDQSKHSTPNETAKVICINFIGRLGNQLFQYASAFGLARKLHRIPVYGQSVILNSALEHPPPTADQGRYADRCRQAERQFEGSCCRFNPALLNLKPRLDYEVGFYLQSWKYFEGLEKDVLNAFRFKDIVKARANESLGRLRKWCNRTLIGVHVRRGDYLKQELVKLGYRTAPAAYFRRAMAYMRNRFGNVTFLVSTADEKWFRQSVTSASDVILLKRQDAVTDMALLTSLDHVIISVGTYSWWVGFLNRGVTVYWKDFIAPGTLIGNGFSLDGDTYIRPNWIPM